MDDETGFFPERRVLALRRQQQASVAVQSASESQNRVVWFVLGSAIFPSAVTLWATLGAPVQPSFLLMVCGLIAVLAVAGIVFGAYRGLTSQKRLARS